MIRCAVPDDAAAIARIWNRVIRETSATFASVEKSVDEVAAMIPARPFVVAEEAGEVVGFGCYVQLRGGDGYRHTVEHSVHVAAGAEGRGLGRALVAWLVADAHAAGMHTMWAGISSENPGAIAFHARLGFTEIARLPEVGRKFDRWMDLVLMRLELAD
ncbi:GNAT family N-acetyltransferase [Pelagovum pacificum]|uniref:N-acetyltransferase family protein n=1 Tax=Pelagovum pacificum TaxID=2588711 RepID=A0A5C5GD16_9RHOB|nr:GNAT family N-acetyltransferase [Pelagovum pacificum]QQA41315.1 N-acetyltransferase [Pelagovum pacificum]TNY31879.1 N-acetyltransferase family protein [Pelagovum pacificum]